MLDVRDVPLEVRLIFGEDRWVLQRGSSGLWMFWKALMDKRDEIAECESLTL